MAADELIAPSNCGMVLLDCIWQGLREVLQEVVEMVVAEKVELDELNK